MKIKTLLWIAIIFITFSCKEKKVKPATIEYKAQTEEENIIKDSVNIAAIGSIKITEQTLQYRLAIETAYENTGLNKSAALIMLINDALEMELAKKYNQQALPIEIEQFKQYADQTSKAPEILRKVKAAFGQDMQAYDLWYISPKIVNRKIRDYFSANKSINQATLNQIKPAMKILRSGEKMKDAAKLLSLTFANDSILVKPLAITPPLQNYPDAALPFENPMLKYVIKMKPGEIYHDIIEENYSFMIIKLLNRNKDRYLIERISVPKPDFETWFRKEASNISIRINDSAIKLEIQNNYGNLWWLRYLN